MKKNSKKTSDSDPLKIYDNLLFISSEKGTKLPLKSDFAIAGNPAELTTAIVIQMNRHPAFAEIMKMAVKIYKNSTVVVEKPSVLNAGLPSRFS